MFYIFHTSYFSWVLMILGFSLLPLSLLISIPVWVKSKLRMECSTLSAPVSDGFSVALRCDARFPICPVNLRLRFENILTGAREDYRLSLASGETVAVHWTQRSDCGIIRCSILRCRILDIIGFFAYPIKKPIPLEVLIHPNEIPFTADIPLLSSSDFLNANTDLRPSSSGEKEQLDVREYKEGDLLRDVHWKLSARTNKLVVREFERLSYGKIRIALLYSGKQENLHLSLGRLLGLCNEMFSQKILLVLSWINEFSDTASSTIQEQELADISDLFLFFRKLFSSPLPPETPTSLNYIQQNDYIHEETLFLVAADAISLLNSGEIKEQYI